MRLEFPPGFRWGTATSAYQVEGSPLADGAGMSNWHRFTHTPGTIANNQNADVACDHYNRYREDVALMKDLGCNAYRFSMSWSRVMPEGRGRVNQAGLDFYSRLVDELLGAGIEPWITLFHWDLPAALQDRGGWPNRDTAGAFGDYAEVVYSALGDRVGNWITLNEPLAVTWWAHVMGKHASGIRDIYAALRTTHHQLLGHGLAVQACRASGAGRVGITNAFVPQHPASDTPEDIAATRRRSAWVNDMYVDPIVDGRYPEVLEEHLAEQWPPILDGDLQVISTPTDFMGVNYYSRSMVEAKPLDGFLEADTPPSAVQTDQGVQMLEIYPDGLYEILSWLREKSPGLPLYITENGYMSLDEAQQAHGAVDDPYRIDYIRSHLAAAHRAIADGADLRGYFVWSLMDNFEWSLGYGPRFGIVRCDVETQERTVKASGNWYREVALANAVEVQGPS